MCPSVALSLLRHNKTSTVVEYGIEEMHLEAAVTDRQ